MRNQSFRLLIFFFILCFPVFTEAQTAGTMTFTYTTLNPGSGWYSNSQANKYVLAVWIESCTTCGAGSNVGTSSYVRTKLRYWGNSTNDHLPTWASKSGSSTTNATTGATQTSFGARTVTWDGTNAAGTTLLADGNYRICIQETWGHGSSTVTRYFPFVKGPSTYTNTTDVAADTHFSSISLVWSPTLANETFSKDLNFVVYPNPTKGFVNIDFKSEVKNIRIVDVQGKEIFNEVIKEASPTTKKIDLSTFENGVYIVTVSDTNGNSSTQRMIVDK